MRVLFWSECFPPAIGGAEVLAAQLLPALRPRGYEFVVVTRQDSPGLEAFAQYRGIPVRRFPFRPAIEERNLDLLMSLRQQLTCLGRDFEPELIHVNLLGPSAMLLPWAAGFCQPPLLVTLHRAYRNPARDTLIGSLLSSADWVAACSAAVLHETRLQVPGLEARSSVILNSLQAPAAPQLPLPFSPPRLLCLGRLLPTKGFDLALAAFASLLERFPAARLTIAGDGPEREPLQRWAVQRGIARAVDFVGWVEPADVPALITASTVVLMPSRYESFGLVALQAAQLCRPVVATRLAGLQEVVDHGHTGLLVEKEDPRALAEAVAALLADPARARRMGRAARLRAREVFRWERYVDDYDALYRALIERRSGRCARRSGPNSVSE